MTQEGDRKGSAKALCPAESPDYAAYAASVTAYDFLGRAVSVATPLGVTSNFYCGASDRLARVSRTGSPDTLYAYDGLGNMTTTAQDVDGDGVISEADAVSSTATSYAEENGVWRHITSSASFRGGVTNASSRTEEQLTGLSDALQSRTVTTAHNGAVTTVTKSFDPGTCVVTETSQTDSATPAVRRTLYGYTLESAGANAATLSSYDGFARVVSQTVTNWTGTVSTSAAVYDTLGNAVTNTVTYGSLMTVGGTAYDDLGQATNTAYSNDTPAVAQTYNAAGLLADVSDDSGSGYGYTYNDRASVTNETVAYMNGVAIISISRTLDNRERPSATVVSVATNVTATFYGYDAENRIAAKACTNAQGRGFQVAFPYENGRSSGYTADSSGQRVVRADAGARPSPS